MANKDHGLDRGIDAAAMEEFSACGFEKASLRRIAAKAGVTVGAIYTRYPTKDALFCGMVQPLIDRIAAAFGTIRGEYYGGGVTPEHMAEAMQQESEAILQLLFADYDRAKLLLCRSAGSSLETFVDGLVERKIAETAAFFRQSGAKQPGEGVLRLLLTGQFQMYVQIIRTGCPPEEAEALMRAAMVYHTGGWLALLAGTEHWEA